MRVFTRQSEIQRRRRCGVSATRALNEQRPCILFPVDQRSPISEVTSTRVCDVPLNGVCVLGQALQRISQAFFPQPAQYLLGSNDCLRDPACGCVASIRRSTSTRVEVVGHASACLLNDFQPPSGTSKGKTW